MKYQNRYRIESHRRRGWDYSSEGAYFITLVTQGRICNLGKIDATNQMTLSDFGKIVETEWLRSFEIRQELICDEYIIMPNHLHAIIIIQSPSIIDLGSGSESVQTHGRASLPLSPSPPSVSQFPIRLPKSISSFLAGFKSAVNSKIDDHIDLHHLNIPKYNRHNHFFQPNYHDHIIRNDGEYQRIKTYIIQNPRKWNEDLFRK
ncbi:transposase [Algoriphagus namhaensis]